MSQDAEIRSQGFSAQKDELEDTRSDIGKVETKLGGTLLGNKL